MAGTPRVDTRRAELREQPGGGAAREHASTRLLTQLGSPTQLGSLVTPLLDGRLGLALTARLFFFLFLVALERLQRQVMHDRQTRLQAQQRRRDAALLPREHVVGQTLLGRAGRGPLGRGGGLLDP